MRDKTMCEEMGLGPYEDILGVAALGKSHQGEHHSQVLSNVTSNTSEGSSGMDIKFDGLTEEQLAKIEGKTPEEIQTIAKEEGHELSIEEIEAIAGGGVYWGRTQTRCPKCYKYFPLDEKKDWQKCPRCGEVFLDADF